MKRTLLWLLLLCFTGTAWATVNTQAYTVSYTCTGGFGPFAFTFPISTPPALTVTMNSVLLVPTSYTIVAVNNNYNNGGSVTLGGSFPCTAGWIIVLTRDTPITQSTQYYDNMPIPMKTFERSLDKLTEIIQELEGAISAGGTVLQFNEIISQPIADINSGSPAAEGGYQNVKVQSVNVGTTTHASAEVPYCSSSVFGVCKVDGTTITAIAGVISTVAAGTVTSVSGTANQVDVATGTTTPVISLSSTLLFPGTITMGAHAADFNAATLFTIPKSAGCTSSADGVICYDTTAKSFHFRVNSADAIGAAFASAPGGSKCLHTNGVTGLITESSSDCNSTAGSVAFSGITGGTNTTAAMVVGVGATLAPTSPTAGVISANQINGTALAGLATGIQRNTTTTGVPSSAELSGDVTTSGSNVVSVVKVNGLAVPASANFVGTNSSRQFVAATMVRAISFPFGSPGGSALSTGILGYVTVPFACTITGWSIQADAGTATIKFLRKAAGTAIPAIGDSINTSGVALSSGTVIQSTTLSDFTSTTVTANDIVAADLITTSGVGYINAQLVCAQ